MGGCAPTDERMDDFEDYVLMLARRYGGSLRHFVVWNEVASAAELGSRAVPHRRVSLFDYMNPTKRNTQEDYHDVIDPFLVHGNDKDGDAVSIETKSPSFAATDVLFEIFDYMGLLRDPPNDTSRR